MGQNCTHQQKRLDQRSRIPAILGGGPIHSVAGLSIEADDDHVDETTATTEQRRPKVLERWRTIEQLRLRDIRPNEDDLLAFLAEVQVSY